MPGKVLRKEHVIRPCLSVTEETTAPEHFNTRFVAKGGPVVALLLLPVPLMSCQLRVLGCREQSQALTCAPGCSHMSNCRVRVTCAGLRPAAGINLQHPKGNIQAVSAGSFTHQEEMRALDCAIKLLP